MPSHLQKLFSRWLPEINIMIDESPRNFIEFSFGHPKYKDWKYTLVGSSAEECKDLVERVGQFLINTEFSFKVATAKHIKTATPEQRVKCITIYLGETQDAELLLGDLKHLLKGYSTAAKLSNSVHVNGAIYKRKDRDEKGNYIPAKTQNEQYTMKTIHSRIDEAFKSSVIENLYTHNKSILDITFKALAKRRYSIATLTDANITQLSPGEAFNHRSSKGERFLKFWCNGDKIMLVTWSNTMIDSDFNWDKKAADESKRRNPDKIIGDKDAILKYAKSDSYINSIEKVYMLEFDGMKKLKELQQKQPKQSLTAELITGFKETDSYDSKDEMRVNDIIGKSNNNTAKQESLSQQMAKAITDKAKAIRRFNAAKTILGAEHVVSKIFASRAQELGGTPVTSKVKQEVTKPKEEPKVQLRDNLYDQFKSITESAFHEIDNARSRKRGIDFSKFVYKIFSSKAESFFKKNKVSVEEAMYMYEQLYKHLISLNHGSEFLKPDKRRYMLYEQSPGYEYECGILDYEFIESILHFYGRRVVAPLSHKYPQFHAHRSIEYVHDSLHQAKMSDLNKEAEKRISSGDFKKPLATEVKSFIDSLNADPHEYKLIPQELRKGMTHYSMHYFWSTATSAFGVFTVPMGSNSHPAKLVKLLMLRYNPKWKQKIEYFLDKGPQTNKNYLDDTELQHLFGVYSHVWEFVEYSKDKEKVEWLLNAALL